MRGGTPKAPEPGDKKTEKTPEGGGRQQVGHPEENPEAQELGREVQNQIKKGGPLKTGRRPGGDPYLGPHERKKQGGRRRRRLGNRNAKGEDRTRAHKTGRAGGQGKERGRPKAPQGELPRKEPGINRGIFGQGKGKGGRSQGREEQGRKREYILC